MVGFLGYNLMSGNEKFYSKYVMPTVLKLMDGEEAHNFAIKLAKYGLVPRGKHFLNEEILVIYFKIKTDFAFY